MARLNLTHHRKFRRLSRALGSPALALGTLELLWLAAYEAADAFVGGAEDIADAVTWTGDPLALAGELAAAGFLDPVGDGYAVHDLWDHAPRYVRLRWVRAHKGAPPEARPWHVAGSSVPILGTPVPVHGHLPVPSLPIEEQKIKSSGEDAARSRSRGGKPVEKDPPNPRVLTRLAYELPPEVLADDEAEQKGALKDLAVRYGLTYDASSIAGALDHRVRTTTAAPRRLAMRSS